VDPAKATDNNLYFIVTAGGLTSQLVIGSASYRWQAAEWLHVRMEWDDSAPVATQLRVLLNGVEPNPGGGTGADYDGAALNLAANFLVGNYRTGAGPPSSFGIYDEICRF
jgi:hypothetical protein